MAWSRDRSQALLSDPNFRALFEDEDSPVMKEIARLTRSVLDPDRTDFNKVQAERGRLKGMEDVWRMVVAEADARQQKPEAAAGVAGRRSPLLHSALR
jgi:hypothetical protein